MTYRSPRAARCWLDTPLDDLSRRGAKTGLPDYLADVARVVGDESRVQRRPG